MPATTYKPELAEQVCQLVEQGATLNQACAVLGVAPSSFRDWVRADRDGLSVRYARAREMLLEHWADEIVDIADDAAGGVGADGKVDHGQVQRARLRVDVRKWWLLSKLRPERYGESRQLTLAGGVRHEHDVAERLEQAVERARALRRQQLRPEGS